MNKILIAQLLEALESDHAYRTGHMGGEHAKNCKTCAVIKQAKGV